MGDSPTKPETIFHGLGVSGGIAEADVLVHLQNDEEIPFRTITAEEVPAEIARFEAALIATRKEILEIQQQISVTIGSEDASIFEAHLLVVEDRTLIDETVRDLERDLHNIEHVFHNVAEKYCRTLATIDDPYLRERVVDIEDVSRRVIRHLLGKTKETPQKLDRPHILVARNLTPSDTAQIDRKLVQGFVTEEGSRTSHSAIVARSLGIPAIVAIPEICMRIATGERVLLDGYNGRLYLNPSEQTRYEYGRIEQKKDEVKNLLDSIRKTTSRTRDGKHIILSANIELPSELDAIASSGAEGVGLFRTEFLYLNRKEPPDEDEQYEAYKLAAERCAPHGAIIRTLDVGGDKLTKLTGDSREDKDFLGYRAIRLCLNEPDLFKTQLRAILRASAHGNIRIMYPMVANLSEVRQANEFLEECKKELSSQNIPFNQNIEVGSMIEVPAAALIADQMAREVDFFSIGTNDLIQYTMAADRGNAKVAHLYQPSHPAILHLIAMTAEAAHRNGIWVGLCGEMAADICLTPLLLGLGIDELSVAITSVPQVKKAIQSLDAGECRGLAEKLRTLFDPSEIEAASREYALQHYPELCDC